MFKRIIFTSVFIFVIGISSCSMWDDVDRNALYEIPVGTITINTLFSDWVDVSIFQDKIADVGTTTQAWQNIKLIKVATNLEKSKLFFYGELEGNISTANYLIQLSNDYSCNGYKITFQITTGSTSNKADICSQSYNIYTGWSASGDLVNKFEITIDLTQGGFILNDTFLISIHSHNGILPYNPIKATYARWAKLR